MFERRKETKEIISILNNELLATTDPTERSALCVMKTYFEHPKTDFFALAVIPEVRLWMRKKMMLLARYPIRMQMVAQWAKLI